MKEPGISFLSPQAIAFVMCAVAAFGCKKVAPPGDYDLASKRITWAPNPVEAGDHVIFTYSVDNLGSSTIPVWHLLLIVNSKPLAPGPIFV